MNIGDMDQIKAGLRDLAEILASYKKNLIQQGFSQQEIIALLVSYQSTLFFPNSK